VRIDGLEGILEIDDFISDEYCRALIDYMEESGQNWTGDRPEITEQCFDGTELLDFVYEGIEKLFNSEIYQVRRFNAVQRALYGNGLDLHADTEGNADIKFSTILYLNDDFIGGYLVYPQQKLAIKPKPGKLVVHSGNISHFVSSFNQDAIRYYMTSFIFKKD
jgi:hypothetical protein